MCPFFTPSCVLWFSNKDYSCPLYTWRRFTERLRDWTYRNEKWMNHGDLFWIPDFTISIKSSTTLGSKTASQRADMLYYFSPAGAAPVQAQKSSWIPALLKHSFKCQIGKSFPSSLPFDTSTIPLRLEIWQISSEYMTNATSRISGYPYNK